VLSDNTVQLITAGTTNVGSFSRNTWHHVDFQFNFLTQTHTFVLDGTTLGSGVPFCRDNGPCTLSTTVPSYGNSFFDVFATLNSNDLGVIDNFSVSNVVPEPASLLLIASGLALLVTKRRMASRKG
jgi:PEP-CTERM motif